MAKQHTHGLYQPVASWAALDERVLGLENDVQKIDQKLEVGLNSLRSDFNSAITSISSKLDAQATPNWGVIITGIGVVIALFAAIGGLAYWPVKDGIVDLRMSREKDVASLIQRDQRIWDNVLKLQAQVDKLEGRMSVNR